MNLVSPGKLGILALIVAGCFAYIVAAVATGNGETTPAWATITLIAGYVTGNGVGALRGTSQAPLFAPKPDPDQGA